MESSFASVAFHSRPIITPIPSQTLTIRSVVSGAPRDCSWNPKWIQTHCDKNQSVFVRFIVAGISPTRHSLSMVTCISELCESEVTALFKQSQKGSVDEWGWYADPYFIIGLRTPQKVLLFGVERVGEDPFVLLRWLMNRESSYNDTFGIRSSIFCPFFRNNFCRLLKFPR